MSVHTNFSTFSTSETLELANTFCPPFSQRVYSIGDATISFESIEIGQAYWSVNISSQEPFPAVHTELIEVTSILDNGVKGISLLTGAPVYIEPSSTAQFFPAEKRQPYIPRESLLLEADNSLAIAFHEGRLPEDLVYGDGVLNPRVPAQSEPYTTGCSWVYGKFYTFKRCDALNLSSGDWCVIAGDVAEYGEYGTDKRLRVRRSSGGYYTQCRGFAYIDVPVDSDTWSSYRVWKYQTVSVNVFSVDTEVDYDGHVSEYLCWLQDHTRNLKIEPMFDSLAEVPPEILNPPAKIRLQRIWVMVSRCEYGYESVHPICLQTGELTSIGGREALYQLDRTPMELPTCPSCRHWHIPVQKEEMCISCLEIQNMAQYVSSDVHTWLRNLRVDNRMEVAQVQTVSTGGHWVLHRWRDAFSDSIDLPDCFRQTPSSFKRVETYEWSDGRVQLNVHRWFHCSDLIVEDMKESKMVDGITLKLELWVSSS